MSLRKNRKKEFKYAGFSQVVVSSRTACSLRPSRLRAGPRPCRAVRGAAPVAAEGLAPCRPAPKGPNIRVEKDTLGARSLVPRPSHSLRHDLGKHTISSACERERERAREPRDSRKIHATLACQNRNGLCVGDIHAVWGKARLALRAHPLAKRGAVDRDLRPNHSIDLRFVLNSQLRYVSSPRLGRWRVPTTRAVYVGFPEHSRSSLATTPVSKHSQ